MHITGKTYLLLFFLLFLRNSLISACTILSGIDKSGHVLVANTEDHRPSMNIYFKVRKGTDSTYGFFGTVYNSPDGWLQGGSNEKGLFFDANELGKVPMRKSAGTKPYTFPVDPGSYVLQHCKTVADVIDFFNTYQLELPGQVHVADKDGHFAIINNDTILTNSSFQLTTNFHPLHHEIGVYPCWRYTAVSDCIHKKGITKVSFEEAMFASMQYGNTMTIYSNTGDLCTGDWTYWAYGYKETPFRFNIHELLKAGDKTILLRDLFPGHPYFKYYKAGGNSTDDNLSLWQKENKQYSTVDKYRIPKALIWNYLFWETNYTEAKKWLARWSVNMKSPGSDDLFTTALVQLVNGEENPALQNFKACLQIDPTSEAANYYIDFINKKYDTDGRLQLKLDGFHSAHIVTVAGISTNPNFYLMHRTASGWEINIKAEPGYIPYYFLVDGKKVLDPKNNTRQQIPSVAGLVEMNLAKLE